MWLFGRGSLMLRISLLKRPPKNEVKSRAEGKRTVNKAGTKISLRWGWGEVDHQDRQEPKAQEWEVRWVSSTRKNLFWVLSTGALNAFHSPNSSQIISISELRTEIIKVKVKISMCPGRHEVSAWKVSFTYSY